MSIVDDLVDLFPDTLVATPVNVDMFGDIVPSGEELAIPCYIVGDTRLVRDTTGREVTSSMRVVLAGVYGVTTHLHRYTLPTRFNPRTDLQAIAIEMASDEDGAHHETVMFP